MNVIAASAQSSLKLAVHATTPNEFSEAPDYAYLEITHLQARALVYLMSLTQQFRGQMARSGLVDPCYDISLGLGERLPNFRLIQIPFGEDQEPQRDRPIVLLPEEFDPESVGENAEHRVECHRIEVGREQVRFSALLRRGDDRFVTTDLNEKLLQEIANQYPTDLPLAALAAPLAGE
ncbi:MAG: hypothetical protein Q8N18_12580 [Opitutaceae bacterium]|nr:hypothetical protein [Opitutaceae bacterium]